MQRPVLILMLRWPIPGRCKTRLAQEIGADNAARIQKRINTHTIAVALKLERQGLVDIQLAISGLSSIQAKEWGNSLGFTKVFTQGKGNLGVRMKRQVLLAQKQLDNNIIGRSTILIGTDLPSLCHRDIFSAIEALRNNEIVLGPSMDGGYWLIGLSERLSKPVVNWPFMDIPWGTNQVLLKTINGAKLEDVSHSLLREQNDVDHLADLSPWQG